MSDLVHVNDNNFEDEVIKSDRTVLVDFSAVWCGPCQRQLPIVETFATQNQDIKVCKVDVDEAPEVSSKYGIRGVPCLMLFKNGQQVGTRVGLTPLNVLSVFVSEKA